MMIGEITDSMLGHIQVHKKGYVASIDNLPLNLNLKAGSIQQLESILDKDPDVAAYSPRIKFGGMLSNFVETTNIRLNGVNPEKEFKTVPLLTSRVSEGKKTLNKGEIFIPVLLSKGMGVKVGDAIVIVATNQDGSVNGKQFKVAGVLESATGPGGRDGYIHIDDAAGLLRMEERQISEVAIRLKDFSNLYRFSDKLEQQLSGQLNPMGKPVFEVHTWEKLTPFFHISRMIDAMTFFIKLMLIAIVLISIMNVMIMAVYERIREIGTIAAIGTLPNKILSMFLIEGLCLGIVGAIIGTIAGSLLIYVLNILKITFSFAQQTGYILSARINLADIAAISATVIIVSVIASLQPAYKAAKMEPIKALRHV
jgi:putative ABC transport system permease protein